MMRVARLAVAGLLVIAASGIARAEDLIEAKVGVLRLSSSAPVFIAQDKGYFHEAGLDIDLKFFDAAQPIAAATTSGDIDFGITAFTAGLYNLAGKGTLKVIGGMSREKAGYPLIGYFASNNAYAAGLKTPKDLAGKRVAVTQVGSSFHYSLGLLADKYGFKLSDVKVLPLQLLSEAHGADQRGDKTALGDHREIHQLAGRAGGRQLRLYRSRRQARRWECRQPDQLAAGAGVCRQGIHGGCDHRQRLCEAGLMKKWI